MERIKQLEEKNDEVSDKLAEYKSKGYLLSPNRQMGYKAAYVTVIPVVAATVLLCLASGVTVLGTIGGSTLLCGALLGFIRMIDTFSRNL